MTDRLRTTIAWVLGGLGVVLLVTWTVAGEISPQPDSTRIDALFPLSWVGFGAVGVIIATRRPRHPVGWLMVGIGTSIAVGLSGLLYADTAVVLHPGSLPAGRAVMWLAETVFPIGWALVPFLVLVFPSGTIASRRWRTLARGSMYVTALLVVASALREKYSLTGGHYPRNPLAAGPAAKAFEAAVPVLILALVAFGLGVAGNTVWRFRRARGAERQQLKWFAYSVLVIPFFFLLGLVQGSDVFLIAAFVLGLNGIAAAIGVAVLRYRLYDIDRVVSRTASYAIVTGLLLASYIGLVVLLGRVTAPFTGGSDLAVAISTLVVAAAFVPVRRRVQTFVDKRFNRARYDASRTIDAFSARLRDAVDIDALGAELQSLIERTMQPAHLSLWLKGPTG